MKENTLSDFSCEDKETDEKEEEIVLLNKDNVTGEAVAYQRANIDKMREELEGLKQDREQRKSFSKMLFFFTCAYMAITLLVIFLCGFSVMHLSDTILVTLLTTTLAEVIGMFNFVARYLFHHK